MVIIRGGRGGGAARTIPANTATTVTVATVTTAAGSTYEINVLGSLAYTPLTFWEDFDATATRAVYCHFRDCSTTPDVITKKIRPSDDTPVDTKIFATAAQTAPRIGRADTFDGATYVPLGENTGLLMQKLATVGDIATETADTWEVADAGVFAASCATVTTEGSAKFVRANNNQVTLTASEPKTAASYEGAQDVGDATDIITWITEMSDGLIAMHLTTNLRLWDSDHNSYPVLPGGKRTARQVLAKETSTGNTYAH